MSQATLIAIGDEVVEGKIVNSNSALIASELTRIGYTIHHHIAVPDNEREIIRAIEESTASSSLICCIGGLGPTLDDKTKQVICRHFGLSLIIDEKWRLELIQRLGPDVSRENHELIDQQASVPQGATLIPNPNGTAPGISICVEKNNRQIQIILFPGPPIECKAVLSQLSTLGIVSQQGISQTSSCRIFRVPEKDVDPFLREIEKEIPQVSCGIYPNYGYVDVVFRIKEFHEEYLQVAQTILREKVRTYLPKAVLLRADNSLEADIIHRLQEMNSSIITAESCTAGAIHQALSTVPGASKVLYGGFIVYTEEMKRKCLGISSEDLGRYPVVSTAITERMAKNALQRTGADIAIATSGYFGPSGPEKEIDPPVGTVCFSICSSKEKVLSLQLHLTGDRSAIAVKAKGFILSHLLLFILGLEEKHP